MKKIIITLIYLMSFLSYSKIITLASFNTARLGESEKDLVSFSKILSKFDIIALEEVMNEDGLKELKIMLPEYDYIISKAVGTKKYKEHYAILYKKDVVDEIKNLGSYEDKKDDFIREPSAFYIKSNKLDMILIPVHSIFGSEPKERALEASKYIDVYKEFYNKTKQDDIIILGDFNLPATDRAFDKLKQEGFINVLKPSVDKTTISKTGLASSYDNIFIIKNNLKAFTKRYGVYDFTNNNHEKIRRYISDHLLIFMELDNTED